MQPTEQASLLRIKLVTSHESNSINGEIKKSAFLVKMVEQNLTLAAHHNESAEPPALLLLAPHDWPAQPAQRIEGSRYLVLSIVHLDEGRVKEELKQCIQINKKR